MHAGPSKEIHDLFYFDLILQKCFALYIFAESFRVQAHHIFFIFKDSRSFIAACRNEAFLPSQISVHHEFDYHRQYEADIIKAIDWRLSDERSQNLHSTANTVHPYPQQRLAVEHFILVPETELGGNRVCDFHGIPANRFAV